MCKDLLSCEKKANSYFKDPYWFVTLGVETFVQLVLLGYYVFPDSFLLSLLPCEFTGVLPENWLAMLPGFIRLYMVIFGVAGALGYNLRLRKHLLTGQKKRCCLRDTRRASLLCSLAGAAAGAWLLPALAVVCVSLTAWKGLLAFAVLMLALSVGWRLMTRFISRPLFLYKTIVQPHESPSYCAEGLERAFGDVMNWYSTPVRLTVSILLFSTTGMMVNALAFGPMRPLMEAWHSRALTMETSGLIEIAFQKAALLAFSGSSYLPVMNGLLSAVAYEVFFYRPLRVFTSPLDLLPRGPLSAAASYTMLLSVMVAGVTGRFWLVAVLCTVLAVVMPLVAVKNVKLRVAGGDWEGSLFKQMILFIGLSLFALRLMSA